MPWTPWAWAEDLTEHAPGTAWTNLSNGVVPDGSAATCALGLGGIGRALRWTFLGVNGLASKFGDPDEAAYIPDGATALGIEALVRQTKSGSGSLEHVDELLLVDGVEVGEPETAETAGWTTGDRVSGGQADRWGGVTTDLLRAPGLALSTWPMELGVAAATAGVDAAALRVYYETGSVALRDVVRRYRMCTETSAGVGAGELIHQGTAVGIVRATGLARPFAAGDVFAGLALQRVRGGEAGGVVRVPLAGTAQVYMHVGGVEDETAVGAIVRALDDATFVVGAAGGAAVGKVVQWMGGDLCRVAVEAEAWRSV